MIKSKKNKIILGVLAGAAVISLASVGFAQWQIGIIKDNVNSDFTFDVDTTTSQTAVLDIELAETNPTIKIGETEAVTNTNGGVTTFGDATGKLTVGVTKFRIIVDKEHALDKVTFSYTVGTTGDTSRFEVTTGAEDSFERKTNTKYSYLALANAEITSANIGTNFTKDADLIPEHIVYTLKNEAGVENPYSKLGFTWGDFFGNVNPGQFYNNKINAVRENNIEQKIKLAGIASKELKDMRTNMLKNGENAIHMSINLTTTEASK